MKPNTLLKLIFLLLGILDFSSTHAQVWTSQTSGKTENLCSVFFIDSNTGYVVGDAGTILKTTNGGNIWTPQISGTTDDLYSVYFCNSNIGYVVGYGGTIIKTINGGDTWTQQSSGLGHFNDAGIPSVFFYRY